MSIAARFPGTCRKCGGGFLAGTQIEWSKGAGSTHTVCPSKTAAPVAPSTPSFPVPDAARAPFESSEKWEACKRPALDRQLASCIGETRRYVKRGPFVRGAIGDARQAPTGLYVVVGTNRGRFESAEDNEDMGDMSGAGWHVVVYLREATAEEREKANRETLGNAIPGIFTALAGMVQRGAERTAKAAFETAASRPGWGKVEVVYPAALGPDVEEARKGAVRLWEAGGKDYSYIATFPFEGETLVESFHYVFDWDLPLVFAAPQRIVDRVNLVQSIVSIGYAMQHFMREVERRRAVETATAKAA